MKKLMVTLYSINYCSIIINENVNSLGGYLNIYDLVNSRIKGDWEYDSVKHHSLILRVNEHTYLKAVLTTI